MDKKLTTVLCSDVIGYSKMMGADEVGTLRKLDECRNIIDPLITNHNGRIFNTAGDSVLAEFASPTDAVNFSVEMQKEIFNLRNGMRWRVGLHLGEVWMYGTNLLGDTVNLAARIESGADYGGICMSGTVYNMVSSKLNDYVFESRGAQQFKNIAQPIEIWAVKIPGSELNPNASIVKPNARLRENMDLVKAVINDRAAQGKTLQDAQNLKRDRQFGPATRVLMWRVTRKCGPSLNELLEMSEKNLVPAELKECVVAIFKEYCKGLDSDRLIRISKLLNGNLGEYPSLSLQFLGLAANTNTEAKYQYASIILNDPNSSTIEVKKALENLEEAARKHQIPAMLLLAEHYAQVGDKHNQFKWLWVARGLRDSSAQSLLERLTNSINRNDFQNWKYESEALLDEIKFTTEVSNYKYT